MQENILAKARKLLALINHPATGAAEKQAATYALDTICQRYNITREQINSIQRIRQEIPYIDIKHDAMLIYQLILLIADSYDHVVKINKLSKIIITELTEAEHAAVIDMLFHYRKEYDAIKQALTDQIKTIKAQAKKETDELWRIREKVMHGIIHTNKIYPPAKESQSTELTTQKSTKKKSKDLADIVAACQIAQGTAYKKPPTNLTTTTP